MLESWNRRSIRGSFLVWRVLAAYSCQGVRPPASDQLVFSVFFLDAITSCNFGASRFLVDIKALGSTVSLVLLDNIIV